MAREAGLGVARAFVFAAPFHLVPRGKRHRLDGGLHLGLHLGGGQALCDVGANGDREDAVAAHDEGVLGLEPKPVGDLFEGDEALAAL